MMQPATIHIPGLPAGLNTPIWGYNGSFPGPTIRATRGDSGQKIVVRQINRLPPGVQTSAHLHGGHQAPEDDGHPTDGFSPGQFRDYEDPNDDLRATTLWYHDHQDDVTGRNVYMGLAGFYLLEPNPADPDFVLQTQQLPTGAQDVPLVVQDRLFNADGSFNFPDEPDGVLGDVQLVNGAVQPAFKVATRRYRFRVLNGSTARVYQLQLSVAGSAAAVPLVVIAAEQGLLPQKVVRDTLLLAPAERRDVIVDFGAFPVGTSLVLHNLLAGDSPDPRRGVGGGQVQVMRFDVERTEAETVGDVPTTLFPLRPQVETFAPGDARVTREFEFDRSGGVWTINGEPFDHGARIDATPTLNDVEIWHLVNSSGGWAHPIHMHDIPFLLLERNERPPAVGSDETGLKDTFFLGPGESVRVIGKFRDNRGLYVFHCHNIEHEDMFMMSQFQVR